MLLAGSLVNQTKRQNPPKQITRHSNFHHATSKRSNSMPYFDFYFCTLATAVFRASTNVLLCFGGGSLKNQPEKSSDVAHVYGRTFTATKTTTEKKSLGLSSTAELVSPSNS